MVAIKCMKMPSNCLDCEFFSNYSNTNRCDFTLEEINETEYGRAEHCPLVEIVTCKDCKYNYENSCDFDGFGIDDEYFCAKGERKYKIDGK